MQKYFLLTGLLPLNQIAITFFSLSNENSPEGGSPSCDWCRVEGSPPFLRSWKEFPDFTQPYFWSCRRQGARGTPWEAAAGDCVFLSVLAIFRWRQADRSLSNMWAARPQKEQVGHVSSAGLFVCPVLLRRLGAGGCGVSCVGDTSWVWSFRTVCLGSEQMSVLHGRSLFVQGSLALWTWVFRPLRISPVSLYVTLQQEVLPVAHTRVSKWVVRLPGESECLCADI